MVFDELSTRTKLPFSWIFKRPGEFVRGVSLFATQTHVVVGTFLYQIPTYQFVLPELKKPNSNSSPAEISVWPEVRGCVAVMVSMAMARVGNKVIEVKKQRSVQQWSFVVFLIVQLEVRWCFSFSFSLYVSKN